MPGRETKLCPVCDSEIDADARRCEFCQTDLSLFDIDYDGELDSEKLKVNDTRNIDDLLASIVGEREVKPEIMETVRSIGATTTVVEGVKEKPAAEAAARPRKPKSPVGTQPSATSEVAISAETFECPACGTTVNAEADSCPECGAQFIVEGIEEERFECPLCNTRVSADARSCPACGAEFVEEREPSALAAPPREERKEKASKGLLQIGPFKLGLPFKKETKVVERPPPPTPVMRPVPMRSPGITDPYARLRSIRDARKAQRSKATRFDANSMFKELPNMVNEMKPMLSLAKRLDINVESSKKLINEAIGLGKQRELAKAVQLVAKAKEELEDLYVFALADRMESLYQRADKNRDEGRDVSSTIALLDDAMKNLSSGKYSNVVDGIEQASSLLGVALPAQEKVKAQIDEVRKLAGEARILQNFDAREIEALLKRASEAVSKRDVKGCEQHLKQARDRLMSVLPKLLEEEMRKSRGALFELKLRGIDISKQVSLLKEANLRIKNKEYAEAVSFVSQFRELMKTA